MTAFLPACVHAFMRTRNMFKAERPSVNAGDGLDLAEVSVRKSLHYTLYRIQAIHIALYNNISMQYIKFHQRIIPSYSSRGPYK